MKKRFLILLTVLTVLTPQGYAQASDANWTISASGSWSQIDSSERDAQSGSISLSRSLRMGSIGVSLATSNGSDALFSETEITDRSSAFVSAWVSFPVGPTDLDFNISHGHEDYDGRLTLDSHRFQNLQGTEIDLNSEVESLSLGATLSRVFIADDWDIIPSATIGWSRSDATSAAEATGGHAVPLVVSEEQSGINAAIGLGFGYLAHDKLYLFSDVSGIYSENAASAGVAPASRLGGLRAYSRQDPDAATWAEVALGASFFATDTMTLSLSGGTTAGRDHEEVFASTTLSISF